MGLDNGPETTQRFVNVVLNSETALWNGPIGMFEMEAFAGGTNAVAAALAKATAEGCAFTLIGGGDSVAAINQAGLADPVSYVSTGGGAMLKYLEGKVLPGIAAIKDEKRLLRIQFASTSLGNSLNRALNQSSRPWSSGISNVCRIRLRTL